MSIVKFTYEHVCFFSHYQHAEKGINKELWSKIEQDPKKSLVRDLSIDFEKYLSYEGPKKYAYMLNKINRNQITSSVGFCGVTDLREKAFSGRLAIVVKEGVPYKRRMDQV